MHYAGRSSIEGFNGLFKRSNMTAADVPGRAPVRGYAAKYLATTMAVLTINARIIDQFYERTEASEAAKAKGRTKRREGTSSEVYHNTQFWIDLTVELGGRDPLVIEELEDD